MISLNLESLSIELQRSYLSIQKKKDNCTLYFNQLILTCILLKFVRNRTSTFIVVIYSLYLYFLLGLSLKNTSKALDIFDDEKRSHIAIWNWIQRFGSLCHIYSKRKRVSAFIIDEIELFRLVVNTFGYGYVLNQFTLQCLESISQRKETCLLLKNSLDLLLKNMVDIQFTLMVVHGIMKHVMY
jgi:hypothetical protein